MAKIILRSDNEWAILDLERQAAAERRVRHGMTVIIDDSTEYESQDNGLVEISARSEVRSTRCCPGSSPMLARSRADTLEPMG